MKEIIPNEDSARKHIEFTIKYYGQMGEDVLEKQLKIAQKGLIVAGFDELTASRLITECKVGW